jgi:O-antigen/teichoic acid export membrane protein
MRWTRLTTGPLLATGLASLVTLTAHALLLGSLPTPDAGLFALSMALVETLSLFGALGQVTLITRLYARQQHDSFDWLRDLARLSLLSTAPIGLGVLLLHVFYPLTPPQLMLVAAATVLTIPVNLSATMLNARLHHTWGALLMRLPNSLLILPAGMALVRSNFNQLDLVLISYTLGAAAVLGLSLLLLARHLPRGSVRISLRQNLEGMIFVVASGSQVLLDQGLLALAGAFLHPTALATFAAIAILLRPFRLVTGILTMVFSPRFIRHDRESYSQPIMGVTTLAIIAAVGAALLTPTIADLIYEGRYASGYGLIPWLAFAGCLLVVRSVPISHLSGRAPTGYINRVVLTESAIVSVVAATSLLVISKLGVLGLVLGLVIGHLTRTVSTFVFWRRFRQIDPHKGQPVSVT